MAAGEYVFGRALDMPHGLDMLIGAGIGATIGGLAARSSADATKPKGAISVVPVIARARKAVLITWVR